MKKIGLIAGGGQFPILFARAARREGVEVVAVALKGETDERVAREVDSCFWIPLGKLGRMIEVFQSAGVAEAVMAGKVSKTKLYSRIRPDWRAMKLLARMVHKKDDALLRAIADELEASGIKIRPSTLFLPQLLAPAGILSRRRPNPQEMRDIEFGWNLAKEIGRLDIGQCLVVKAQAVVAVEAIEGTDETIRRGGRLAKGGAVVIKVSKPAQDLRFDVPAVGLKTIETMQEVAATVLVVEAESTLMFDREEMMRAADRAGIAIVSKRTAAAAVAKSEKAVLLNSAPESYPSRSGQKKRGRALQVASGPEAVRVAVVGVGHHGQFHAEKYAGLLEADLVAVVDTDGARSQQIAERVGCQARRSHSELIGKVDAVSVVVPTPEHYAVARDLLEAGIHVLVEKPMTASLAEADSLIRLAEAKGLVLQVGHLERFNPALVAAREHVVQPLFLESHRLASFTERGIEVDVILDLMIHDIDIILSLVPYPLEDLRVGGVKVLTPYPDIASARLEFANGCIANVTASRISAKKMRKIRVFQPDSYLSIDYADKEVELFRKLPELDARGYPQIEYQQLPVSATDPLEEELKAFVRSVRHGLGPAVSGSEGRKALEVAIRVSELIQRQMEQIGGVLGLA